MSPKNNIRILGIQIDTKLTWGPHIRKVEDKMTRQTAALTRLTTSTWGASFAQAKRIYSAVVRPAITYGSSTWHTPSSEKGASKTMQRKLAVIQNKCLRVVAGAFKATPIEALEKETHTPPMHLHLDRLAGMAQERRRVTGMDTIIKKACQNIKTKLKSKRGRRRNVGHTPGERKSEWVDSLPGMRETNPTNLAKRRAMIRKIFAERWKDRWNSYRQKTEEDRRTPVQRGEIQPKNLRLHTGLARAESSLATQTRAEKIGFASFLYKRHMPGVTTETCPLCERGNKQTAKHILMFCSKFNESRRHMLDAAGTQDYCQLVEFPEKLRRAVKWLMQLGLLGQFSLARECLYGEE